MSRIQKISISIIFAIDALFLYKYGLRYYEHILLVLAFFLLIKGIAWYYLIFKSSIKITSFVPLFLAFFFVCLSAAIFMKIDPSTTKVDRWDAVVYWWDAVFDGIYPYSIRTRLEGFPSPFPFLQLICLPFYLMGEIGLTLVALIFVLFFVLKYYLKNQSSSIHILFLMASSIGILWELSVRSTISINAILLLLVILFSDRKPLLNFKNTVIMSILCGLLLSTRLVMILPLLLLGCYYLHQETNLKYVFLLVIGTVIVFSITFLPVVLFFDANLALANNPLLHHDRHMPHVLSIVLLLCTVLLGYSSCTIDRLIFNVGFILLLSAIFFISLVLYEDGWETAISKSKADISYLLFSYIPLCYSASVGSLKKSISADL